MNRQNVVNLRLRILAMAFAFPPALSLYLSLLENQCGRGTTFSGLMDLSGGYLLGFLYGRSVCRKASAYTVCNKHKKGNVRVNETFRRVRESIVAVKKKNKVLRFPTRKAHAPYLLSVACLALPCFPHRT